jgi:hypothetical protein
MFLIVWQTLARNPQMAEPETAPEGEAAPDWEAAADEAIGLCGGDARATVIALLHMNNALEHEIGLMRGAMSFGYSRGCFHKGGSDVETQG